MNKFIEVTYQKSPFSEDSREFASFTIEQDWLPRKEELISLNIATDPDLRINESFRVSDLDYHLSNEGTAVTIYLD